jgi:hypothetical protein
MNEKGTGPNNNKLIAQKKLPIVMTHLGFCKRKECQYLV